jgi:ABC-2 type transport system ATP-binding protein
MISSAIKLTDATKTFGNFTLGPINLTIPSGSIVGYIGENGAGKSTTIKLMLGLMKADSGSIEIFNTDINKFTTDMKKDIAYVFDNLYLPKDMTLKSARKFHEKLYKDAWDNVSFSRLVKHFNLPENKAIKHFSRGMKMQLGLALALSHNAKLLLLDEPTSGLDPVIRDDVLDLLLEYIQDEENTVLVSSHILSDLEKIADYIAFIHEGKLLFMDTKDGLIEKYGKASIGKEQLDSIDKTAIVGKRTHKFGVELLLKRELAPKDLKLENPSIEDIMVYMIRRNR